MNCSSCGKTNSPGSKFCKHCGASLNQKFKTCNNGHNYDSSLSDCPYCPGSEVARELKTSTSNKKTVIDRQEKIITEPEIPSPQSNAKSPTTQPASSEKTVIENVAKKKKAVKDSSSLIKLVGWLVSYDIDPAGNDFKLYEGRTKIGRSNYCKIILNDSTISEEHALLFYKDKKFILQDELSANGTFVNGKRIEERALLKDGDEIKLGSVTFIIKII
ncbi:MAG: FHA domain-containing protein [Bacteroidetes bacterium]|nr:FHA domain-containing protein [Bacteroidota bacterium]MCH8035389.1 FHA domain-containing protein [Bacteroidota bacterium]